jgi:hypothetical protein
MIGKEVAEERLADSGKDTGSKIHRAWEAERSLQCLLFLFSWALVESAGGTVWRFEETGDAVLWPFWLMGKQPPLGRQGAF